MRPPRFFLISFGLAAVVAGAQLGYALHLDAQVERARSACIARGERDAAEERAKQASPDAEKGPWTGYKLDTMVCSDDLLRLEPDARNLSRTPGMGEQKLLLLALVERNQHAPLGYLLAGIIAAVGCMPALWYFLLRRLAEVADAVRGRPRDNR
ncbi:MAG: hypothetical protein WCK28_00735 [Burkholderiales bacterium]